jgi:hypothetical protein
MIVSDARSGRSTNRHSLHESLSFIRPHPDELAWQAIPMQTSIPEALGIARREDKPLLLWAMNGNPLALTSNTGVTGRELVFSNPAVVRLLTDRFVPVADDVSRLQVSEDAVGRFFRYVDVQGHMRGRLRAESSHQGTYAFTADGMTLANGNSLQANATLVLLARALDTWETREGAEVDANAGPGILDERHDSLFPKPGARCYGRWLETCHDPACFPGTGAVHVAMEFRSCLAPRAGSPPARARVGGGRGGAGSVRPPARPPGWRFVLGANTTPRAARVEAWRRACSGRRDDQHRRAVLVTASVARTGTREKTA